MCATRGVRRSVYLFEQQLHSVCWRRRKFQIHLYCYVAHAMAHELVGQPVVKDRELGDVGNQTGAVSASEEETRKLWRTVPCQEILLRELGDGQELGRNILSYLLISALARLMATRVNSGWPLLQSAVQARLKEAYAMHFPSLQASVQAPLVSVRPSGVYNALYAGLPEKRLCWLWVELWALLGPGPIAKLCPKKILWGGPTHENSNSLIPWFDFLYYLYPCSGRLMIRDQYASRTASSWFRSAGGQRAGKHEHYRDAMRENLDEFIWWLDILGCDRADGLECRMVECPCGPWKTKSIWSGVLANPDIIGDECRRFCFQLNLRIHEPGTGNWRPDVEHPMSRGYNRFECRLVCISRHTSKIVCYADTRFACAIYNCRIFHGNHDGARAFMLKLNALCDNDDDGCVFSTLYVIFNRVQMNVERIDTDIERTGISLPA